MKIANWGAFVRSVVMPLAEAIAKAVRDYQANTLPVTPPPMTGAQIAAALKSIQPAITADLGFLAAHPGLITAADDLLAVFQKQRWPWATTLRDLIDATPGVGANILSWLPMIADLLAASTPAPTYQAGPDRVGR